MRLPILDFLPKIAEILSSHSCLLVSASPGSGKTTQIPAFLMESLSRHAQNQVWVLEPRRLAAKLSAARVADERNEVVGDTVGYHFRFEKSFGPKTRLLFLTEGMFIRRLQRDPSLTDVAMVILDEFHERSLNTDLAIALIRRLQKSTRPDLKLVVMSATLDTQRVASYLDSCPVITVEAPRFPIDTVFWEKESEQSLADSVTLAVRRALAKQSEGDVLVFLPGLREIRSCENALASIKNTFSFQTHLLYGDLPPAEQEASIRPAPHRKVILSTNIAETSLTIEGVRCVIDCGLQRSASYSHWSGMTTLSTKPISRASAIQREGRAGRLGPGMAFRLYTKSDFDNRPAFDLAEVLRSDLSQTVLQLIELGINDLSQFCWFEAPSENAIQAAIRLLLRLGAIESAVPPLRLTAIGREIVTLPLHPRLGRFLLTARQLGLLEAAIPLCAVIQHGDFSHLDVLEISGKTNHHRALDRMERQIRSLFARSPQSASPPPRSQLGAALLAGFPDRVGQVRRSASGKWELRLSEGETAKIDDDHLVDGDFFVLVDVHEKKNERSQVSRWARAIVRIEPEWLLDLPGNPITEQEEVLWDETRLRAIRVTTLCYGQIVLESGQEAVDSAGSPQSSKVTAMLVEKCFQISQEKWHHLSPEEFVQLAAKFADKEAVEGLLTRIFLVLGSRDQWPRMRQQWQDLYASIRSMRQIEDRNWLADCLDTVPADVRSKLDFLAPEYITLSSHRKAKVKYLLDRSPWLESRIQDFFGMTEVPCILSGKLPLTLHLLAPNYTAIQVTRDLKGFWERDYQRVRKEFSRRYPRHSWPEDPYAPPAKNQVKK